MAAEGGAQAGELNMLDMVEEFSKRGNQIFVSMRKGKEYPPVCCDVRCQYEETIADLKKKVEEHTGIPVDKQLLFWHFKELTSEYDGKTLLDLNLHTGFSLTGYDLTEEPHYWPPVTKTPEGLKMVTKSTYPNELPKRVIHEGYVK
ncbi:ubiquitin-like domain-containing protein [Chloropicon roscoffensis]|uniref:Ubiquitin-like domain-containing protein n=2 Tax=Chloropicon roscoffensis TaxID=1461544 RepID=A0AAX4PBM5_9CHLO